MAAPSPEPLEASRQVTCLRRKLAILAMPLTPHHRRRVRFARPAAVHTPDGSGPAGETLATTVESHFPVTDGEGATA